MNCYGVSGFLVISKSYHNLLLQQQDRKQINQTKEYFIDWPKLPVLLRTFTTPSKQQPWKCYTGKSITLLFVMLSKLNIGYILKLSVRYLTADDITRS